MFDPSPAHLATHDREVGPRQADIAQDATIELLQLASASFGGRTSREAREDLPRSVEQATITSICKAVRCM
jgi:hypothetical protein